MAGSLEDVASWLPTEFLTEEELLMGKENFNNGGLNAGFKPSLCFGFPTDFLPYEFESLGSSSALSSPVESFVSSTTETESSEEDDFLSGLTRRLAQQFAAKPEKKWVVAGSPESTLSGIGSWSVSSNGSPNGVLSPPTTPFGTKNDTWDLIYAAAGQVARLKVSNESNEYRNYQRSGLLGPCRSQNLEAAVKNQNTGFYTSQKFGHNVPQVNQYQHHLRRDQVPKPQCSPVWSRQPVKAGWQTQPQPQYQHPQQQIQNRGRGVGCENGRCVRPPGLPHSVWPHLQEQPNQHHLHQKPHQSNSGMRAVFLGGSGVKKECSGTGVFLPRRYGNPPESKKKSACSPVLLPDKVVQALNLNFDDMNINGHTQPRFNTAVASDYGNQSKVHNQLDYSSNYGHDNRACSADAFMARRNALLAQQRQSLRPEAAPNHELRLPHEWTY